MQNALNLFLNYFVLFLISTYLFFCSFSLPPVLFKNVGWGNFDGYDKLEAAMR